MFTSTSHFVLIDNSELGPLICVLTAQLRYMDIMDYIGFTQGQHVNKNGFRDRSKQGCIVSGYSDFRLWKVYIQYPILVIS